MISPVTGQIIGLLCPTDTAVYLLHFGAATDLHRLFETQVSPSIIRFIHS